MPGKSSFFTKGIIFAVILITLVGCIPSGGAPVPEVDQAPGGQPASSGLPVEVTDAMGRTLMLEELPGRIVSLSPSVTESLFAIGANDLLVARDDYSVHPPAALELPEIPITPGSIPLEQVLAYEPDLVIAGEILNQETVQSMEELGLQVYIMPNPDNFEDLYSSLVELARIAGREDNASMMVGGLRTLQQSVVTRLGGTEGSVKVFYELDATDPQNPWTAGADTFIDMVIGMAGGENIARAVTGDWVQISAEEIIAQNPDVIILADAEWGITPESVADRPGWEQVAAVQNGRVVPFDSNLLSVPGPRLVQGLEQLAKILHPAVFEE